MYNSAGARSRMSPRPRFRMQKRNALIAIGLTAAVLVSGLCVATLYVSWRIDQTAHPLLFADPEHLPRNDVGLVLGTSRNRGSGLNEFYAHRIAAAAELYDRGKIRHIIVSGSNPSKYYDEPDAMRRDLMVAGVPANCITEDRGGLRTLDSVVRAHKVMGQTSFTIISQRFHATRAVYIGINRGLDVVAYCAQDASGPQLFSARLREYGARMMAMLDLNVWDTQPQYLGQPVTINLRLGDRTALK